MVALPLHASPARLALLKRRMLAATGRRCKGPVRRLRFASPLHLCPLPAFCAPITQRRHSREEKQKMGFTLDQNTIRELAATIASEVVKALSEAQLVNDTRAAMAKI